MRKLSILIFCLFQTVLLFAQPIDSSLIVGEYAIEKITDGDTFRFKDLDKSSRLLGIDTEETYKDKKAREKSFELGKQWPEIYYKQQKDAFQTRPVKVDTPFGYETWMWTKEFSSDVSKVRLEKDDESRYIDTYGRYLLYVFMLKDGKWINYNIECVKQGYSPYYNKYGNSKRFHKEFTEAQKYAKENKLGIWNSDTKCYPDYDQRIIWWDKRAAQIQNFEDKYSKDEKYFNLMNTGEYERMENMVGKEIVVFGNISDVLDKKTPFIIRMGIRKGLDFELIIFEENSELLEKLDISSKRDYYIYAKGKLSEYKGKLQIVLTNAVQLWME